MLAINLATLDERVTAPAGIVYSTDPRRARGHDDKDYFVKGPESEVVFAELAGCLLASAAGIIVAPVAVCRFAAQTYAGSEMVASIGRNVAPWLSHDRAVNFPMLYEAIVVDAWLANIDRNLGNVVARPSGHGKAELVFIDYEKSVTLRQYPLIKSTMVEPAKLWPTGELGSILRQHKPLLPPTVSSGAIRELGETDGAIQVLIDQVLECVGPIEWAESSVEATIGRAKRIDAIVGEVWQAR
jgi:hypothetical protein